MAVIHRGQNSASVQNHVGLEKQKGRVAAPIQNLNTEEVIVRILVCLWKCKGVFSGTALCMADSPIGQTSASARGAVEWG